MSFEYGIQNEARTQYNADRGQFQRILAEPKTERNRRLCEELFIRMEVSSALSGSAFAPLQGPELTAFRRDLVRYSQDLSALNPETLATVAAVAPGQAARFDEEGKDENDGGPPQLPPALRKPLPLHFAKASEPLTVRTCVGDGEASEVSLRDFLPHILEYAADEGPMAAITCREFANIYRGPILAFLNEQLSTTYEQVLGIISEMQGAYMVDVQGGQVELWRQKQLYDLFVALGPVVLTNLSKLPTVQDRVARAILCLFHIFCEHRDRLTREDLKRQLLAACSPVVRTSFEKIKDIQPFVSYHEARRVGENELPSVSLGRAQVTFDDYARREALYSILSHHTLTLEERDIVQKMLAKEPNDQRQLISSFLRQYHDPFERLEMCQKLGVTDDICTIACQLNGNKKVDEWSGIDTKCLFGSKGMHPDQYRLPELYDRWKVITDPQFRARMAEIFAPYFMEIGSMQESHEMTRAEGDYYRRQHFQRIVGYAFTHHRLPELVARDSSLAGSPYEPVLMSQIVDIAYWMAKEKRVTPEFAAEIQLWALKKLLQTPYNDDMVFLIQHRSLAKGGLITTRAAGEEATFLYIEALIKVGKKEKACDLLKDMDEGPWKEKAKALLEQP